MMRSLVRTFAAAVVLLSLSGCDSREFSGPGRGVATVTIAPEFVANGIAHQLTAPPIDRIRLTAKTVPDGTILATETITVDPTEAEWELDFGIELPDGAEVTVVVTIELMSSSVSPDRSHWSGVTAPFVLTQGPIGSPVQVPVFRGPLENVAVTGVSVTPASPTVQEGGTTPLTATTSGGASGTVVFWESLDPSIATVNESGIVTGVVPGTARIVATAGPRSTTTNVTVTVRVASIEVLPATATLQSVGATQQYTARAVDPRGATVNGVTITFSVAPSNVATHNGSGIMRAVGNGTATVTASGGGATGNAVLTVAQLATTVVVNPPSATISNIGGTTTFTAEVRDPGGAPIPGAPVTWQSSATNVATVNATGVVTGVAAGTATITARFSPTVSGTATVGVGAQVFFTDGFEGPLTWTSSSLPIRTNGVGIVNTFVPTYVTLAPGDNSGGALPTAPQGSFYIWFGAVQTGNYIGQHFTGDQPDSGGESTGPVSGSLVSPSFTIPAGTGTVFLNFRTWFEIEGFNPSAFDIMRAEVIDAVSLAPLASTVLNFGLGGTGETHEPSTSGGDNVPPIFKSVSLAVPNAGGRNLRIRFTFDTGDEQFNGFRGWIVDDVRVTLLASLMAGIQSGSTIPLQACNQWCPVPARRR